MFHLSRPAADADGGAFTVTLIVALALFGCGSDSGDELDGPRTVNPPATAGTAGTSRAGTGAGSGGAGASHSGGRGGGTAGRDGEDGGAGSSTAGTSAAGKGGAGGAGGTGGAAGGAGQSPQLPTQKFSFFLTSVGAMKELSKSPMGFGGDLRFGKPTGLEGADEICRQIAEKSLPGAGEKTWRAFLSATAGGPNGGPVHAKDRIGDGPWYDRLERLVAMNKADLIQPRPRGADPAIINDLPNEKGVPNHLDGAPGCVGNACPDNHQVLTGTNPMGMLYSTNPGSTCSDWTNSMPTGMPWCGHSWPRQGSGVDWMSSAADGGCAPCVSIVEMGGVRAPCVGSAGGYGGIYCFALTP